MVRLGWRREGMWRGRSVVLVHNGWFRPLPSWLRWGWCGGHTVKWLWWKLTTRIEECEA